MRKSVPGTLPTGEVPGPQVVLGISGDCLVLKGCCATSERSVWFVVVKSAIMLYIVMWFSELCFYVGALVHCKVIHIPSRKNCLEQWNAAHSMQSVFASGRKEGVLKALRVSISCAVCVALGLRREF
jgi:hypothetical protein